MNISDWIVIGSIIVSMVISGTAIAVSYSSRGTARDALKVAKQAQADTRAVAHLDIKPALRMQSRLHTTDQQSPYIRILNDGRVDAVSVTVQFLYLTFAPGRGFIDTAMYGDTERWHVDRIQARHDEVIAIPRNAVDVTKCWAPNEPMENVALEVRLTYLRWTRKFGQVAK